VTSNAVSIAKYLISIEKLHFDIARQYHPSQSVWIACLLVLVVCLMSIVWNRFQRVGYIGRLTFKISVFRQLTVNIFPYLTVNSIATAIVVLG